MGVSKNPLREIADHSFAIDAGPGTLVANGIYGVEDIVKPALTEVSAVGDPRMYSSTHRRSSKKQRAASQRGWLSPARKARGDSNTIFQLKFNQPRSFNFVSFELLRVPQNWTVWYHDSSRQRMVKLSDASGRAVSGSISGFRINVTDPKNTTDQAKKWRLFQFDLPTITTSLVEIRMNRDITQGNLQDFFDLDQDTTYSLGVRHVLVKMKQITDPGDDSDEDGIPTPIGTVERNVIARHPSRLAHDNAETTYWESAPQGAASSVVPFYLDARAADGTAVLFDTLMLKPLWPGASMNVYFSNDDTTTPWVLSGNTASLLTNGSASLVSGTGLLIDQATQGATVGNEHMRADLSKDFSVGLQYTPTSVSGIDRWLWQFKDPSNVRVGLKFDPTSSGGSTMTGQFKVMQDNGTTLYTSGSYVLTQGTQYAIVVGYNHSDADSLFPRGYWVTVGANTTETGTGATPTGIVPQTFRIGNRVESDAPALGYVTRVWVRQDSFNESYARAYVNSPDGFIRGIGDPGQRVNGHYNALLAARMQTSLAVRVGPGGGYFRGKTWTPVPIDYTLSTSRYEMPLLAAKYLKLEFSNLVPRVYLTAAPTLPVATHPQAIRNYFAATRDTGIPYTPLPTTTQYEGVPSVRTPGDPRKLPSVRAVLEGRGGGGVPAIVFHKDQSSASYAINPSTFDQVTRFQELERAVQPQRFVKESRHSYDTFEVPAQKRAFFCGIKELSLYRRNLAIQFDAAEYSDTFDDAKYIASSTGFVNIGASYQASATGNVLTGTTLPSFSKFQTAQVAVLDSGWETQMTPEQINLNTLNHLLDADGVDLDSSTQTSYTVVTGQYQGARGGNVIRLFDHLSNTTTYFGIRTQTGIAPPVGSRVSAAVRMQLPTTNRGVYELRLWANNSGAKLVARKRLTLPAKGWREFEVLYTVRSGDTDFQAEIVQLSGIAGEAFVIDMLGVWNNPLKWEISNDNGGTWQVLETPLNKPNGYMRFAASDYRLKVRVTAARAGAIVSGYTVIPWYAESPMVVRAPIDYNPPWGVSDRQDLRDTSHKPIFQVWSHYFPQRYSVNLLGIIPPDLVSS